MTDADATLPEPPASSGKLPILIGVVLACLLGAGGFFVTSTGLLGGKAQDEPIVGDLPDIAFVPIPPVTVSLPPSAQGDHLRFTAELEVNAPHGGEVADLMPRIVDVLNGYLRAVDPASLQETAALVRIRAQLLRRIQIVTGEGRVRDLLVSEFVFN